MAGDVGAVGVDHGQDVAAAFAWVRAHAEELGIDAANLYGLGRTSGTLSKADLDVDSPYNVRKFKGLPPTPVCLPGKASLAAAIQAPQGSWRYYVLTTKDPPSHFFTDSYKEFVKAKADAQAVLMVASGSAVVDATNALRTAVSAAQIVTLSNNASSGFIQSLGANARGVIVTQVFPNERAVTYPMVKEAQELAKTKGLTEISPAMLEGFAAAKVLVEGLRRAGPNGVSCTPVSTR